MKMTNQKKIRNRYISYRFTVGINTKELGECETLPTPPIKFLFNGSPQTFNITRINVYQGRKGNELLTSVIDIK